MSHRKAGRRPAATTVESVLIFVVFLVLVLGMIDGGLAVFRRHLVSDAARQVARQASVHGELADRLGTWGPATVGPATIDDGHPACAVASAVLPGFDPQSVTLQIDWPDGGTSVGMRVRVTLTASYPLIFPHLWGGEPLTLSGVSTRPITH